MSIFFVFVGFLFSSFAAVDPDQGGELNQKDAQGRKQGKWVYLGKDRPTAGYPAEGKIEEMGA